MPIFIHGLLGLGISIQCERNRVIASQMGHLLQLYVDISQCWLLNFRRKSIKTLNSQVNAIERKTGWRRISSSQNLSVSVLSKIKSNSVKSFYSKMKKIMVLKRIPLVQYSVWLYTQVQSIWQCAIETVWKMEHSTLTHRWSDTSGMYYIN